MENIVYFTYLEDEMCLQHVFLYLKELNESGINARLVIEGKSTLACAKFEERNNELWEDIKNSGYIDCICKACSIKTFAYDTLKETDLEFSDELKGHPSMKKYIEKGYKIITL